MKSLKFILTFCIALVFVGCEQEDNNLDFIDNTAPPTNTAIAFSVTQDNTGLVTLTPNADGAAQFEIDYGDGSGSSGIFEAGGSTDNIYSEGNYTVGLKSLGVTGAITESSHDLVVSFQAPQNVMVTIENDGIVSNTVRVNVSADFATMYEVDFGNGNNDTLTANIDEELVFEYTSAGIYTIRVTVMSAAIETFVFTEEFEVTAILAPIVSAATPPNRADEDVIAVFSEAYDYNLNNDFFPFWGQSNEGYAANEFDLNGDLMLQYTNLSFQGIQLAQALDVSAMETLHLDVWTPNDFDAKISPISTGPNETAFDLELTAGEWTSFDIPLSFFTDQNPLVDLTDIIQFKFDGVPSGEGTIFVDNIYFYRASTTTGPFDDGLLTNGDFENGSAPWIVGVDDASSAPVVTEAGNTFYSVDVTSAGDAFAVNLSQKLEILEGEMYTLTFDAWSNVNRSIIAGIGLSGGDFSNNSEPVDISTTITNYSLTLTAAGFGATDARVLFDLGAAVGIVNIDNVSLKRVVDNLLTNGDFENGGAPWILGVDDANVAPVVTESGNTFYSVDVTSAGDAFAVNLSQKLEIIEDETYTLTFDAWSNVDRSIIAGIGLSGGDFSNNSEPVDITTAVTNYSLTLTAAGFGALDARVLFDLGAEVGIVNIDNVVLSIN